MGIFKFNQKQKKVARIIKVILLIFFIILIITVGLTVFHYAGKI